MGDQKHNQTDTALTDIEVETLQWLIRGYAIHQVAAKLGKSVSSVNKYLNRAKKKLGAKSRDQLVAMALQSNLL